MTGAPLGRCPACLATIRHLSRMSGGELRFWRCGSCGVVYSDPQPRDEVVQKYTRNYDLADHFGAYAARKQVLFERRLDRLPRPTSQRNALCDIGTGDGLFLELAALRGWDGIGVELNPPAAQRARGRGVEVVEGAIEQLKHLPRNHFHLVTAWDSIEHSPHPRIFARRLAELVVPGGVVAVTTLNRRSLVAAVFRSKWSMVAEDHFTIWDQSSLRRLLASVGLCAEAFLYSGLGRDFFRLVDRAQRYAYEEPRAAAPQDWTTHSRVLAAERLVNRFLNATHTGVEIEVIARSHHTSPRGRADQS